MTIGEWAARLRYRYVPDHVVGEVLGRSWTDNVIPVALLIALTLYLAAAIPNFVSVGNISDTARQIGEYLKGAMSRTLSARIGYFFARSAFRQLREVMDPRKANGGVFLGLNGIVIKSHGSTDAEGFAAAIERSFCFSDAGCLSARARPLSNPQCSRTLRQETVLSQPQVAHYPS